MQKRHHTIPRCYLENFSDENGRVWVLDTSEKIFDILPKNILVESHFYRITLKDGTKSLVVEDTLANIEGMYATIFNDKIAKKLPLTQEEKAHVSVFVAAMMHRTQPNREEMRSMLETLKCAAVEWREQFKALSPEQRDRLDAAAVPSHGTSMTVEELEAGLKDWDEHHAATLISQTMHTAQIIFEMNWAFWCMSDPKNTFVTSDAPFVVERPAAIRKYGRGTFGSRPGLIYEDSEVTLPLSKDKLLLAGRILETDGNYIDVPSDIADQLNQRTILHSATRIVAYNKPKLEEIRENYPSKSKIT